LVQLPAPQRRYFRMAYDALATAMIVAPAAVIVMTYMFGLSGKKIFIVEWVGIATFSAYWALKSYELSMSGAERMAISGQKMPTIEPAGKLPLRKRASRFLD